MPTSNTGQAILAMVRHPTGTSAEATSTAYTAVIGDSPTIHSIFGMYDMETSANNESILGLPPTQDTWRTPAAGGHRPTPTLKSMQWGGECSSQAAVAHACSCMM
jgi:hypothetical protein